MKSRIRTQNTIAKTQNKEQDVVNLRSLKGTITHTRNCELVFLDFSNANSQNKLKG